MRLTQIIEALLFASDAPLSAADLARVDERLDEDTVSAVIDELRREYDETDRSFQVYELAGGYQLLTRPEYSVVLEQWETVPQTTRLSLPALEVLAIIAYRQPLGRAEIEEIRGVQSAAVLRTLQDRGLVEPVGRAEGLGRPMLYGTTRRFLDHFGFRSLEDLPRPDELPVVLRERPVEPTAEAGETGEASEPAQPAAEVGETGDASGPAQPAGDAAETPGQPASEPATAEAAAEPGSDESGGGADDTADTVENGIGADETGDEEAEPSGVREG